MNEDTTSLFPKSTGGPPEGLLRADVFELLKNSRRRSVLAYFYEQRSDAVSLQELVDYVTARETNRDAGAIDADDRTAVYVSLHQTHLPRLEEHGTIEYDRNGNVVSITPKGRRLAQYLYHAPGSAFRWSRVFLGLSLLWLLSLFVVWSGSLLDGIVRDDWPAFLCVGTFLVASAGYAWTTWSRSPGRTLPSGAVR